MSEHQRWRNLHRPVAHALHARRPRARRAARGGRRAAGVAVTPERRAREYVPLGPIAPHLPKQWPVEPSAPLPSAPRPEPLEGPGEHLHPILFHPSPASGEHKENPTP